MLAAAEVTVNATPVLGAPATVTTTFPDVAPFGTAATMLVPLHELGTAAVPLNVTVLAPCVAPKFVPVIVTAVPTIPEVGDRLVMVGSWATSVTVQVKVLLLVSEPSEAVAVTLYVPALVRVSVPAITPVVEFTLNDAGRPVAL